VNATESQSAQPTPQLLNLALRLCDMNIHRWKDGAAIVNLAEQLRPIVEEAILGTDKPLMWVLLTSCGNWLPIGEDHVLRFKEQGRTVEPLYLRPTTTEPKPELLKAAAVAKLLTEAQALVDHLTTNLNIHPLHHLALRDAIAAATGDVNK
jgi:hypothetical protein